MALRDLLPTVRRLEHLPRLARALGLDPCWEEVSLAAMGLAPAQGGESRAAIVGRRGSFLALGVATVAPAAAARRFASTLAANGWAALVAALDEGRATLAIAAGFADAPTLVLRPDHPRPVDLARLARGAAATGVPSAALAARWAEALGGEELGGRFFRAFRHHLRRLTDAMPSAVPAADRHGRALLDLTRILFLYFVQERGWLDGRRRFLREELDRCLAARQPVETGFLAPLFFGTLNVPRPRRSERARRFGVVPFLNGGLFERHPVERRGRTSVPDALWRDAFDQLFERYHFTTAPGPDAIGPDMLGRVFEGVMDPDDRRAEGAFYTPASLVDQLVEASVTHWLAGHLGIRPDRARPLLDRPTAAALDAMRHVKVLDPAVGSGAFLLGALRRLVATRMTAGEDRRTATRAVLAHNLFGVDRNASAVRLAELRLWLEVIAAEPPGHPGLVEPLPNLDGVVRQGDSLAEPIGLAPGATAAARTRLGELRARLVTATGSAKRRLVRSLRQTELATGRAVLERAIAAAERRITDARHAARAPDLFGRPPAVPAALRRVVAAGRAERRRLRQLHRRLREAGELPWFQFEIQFADVAARGGFDLVIGNPPWVRAESIPAAQRRALKRRFEWFRSPGGSGRYAHLPDLSIAFLERGFGLLRPGGVSGVLLPAKLLTATYAATAREELARRGTLMAVADLTERARSAFDATVFPLALVVVRGAAAPGHLVATHLEPDGVGAIPQASLDRSGWQLHRVPGCDPVGFPTVGDRFRVRLGTKTGLDRAFLDPPVDLDPAITRRALRGRDIRAFRTVPARRLLWPYDHSGRVLERLPAGAARHLAPHERALRLRADYRSGPWWILFRTESASAAHRVVWRDLARELECAVVSSPSIIPLNTTYVIGLADRATALRLAAWLNSGWVRRLAAARATVAASGYRRFNAGVIETLPLPGAVLRDDLLLRLAREASAGRPVDQEALDARVAEILGRSDDRSESGALD